MYYNYNDFDENDFDPMRFEDDEYEQQPECPYACDCPMTRNPAPMPPGPSGPGQPPMQPGQGPQANMPPGPPPAYTPQSQFGSGMQQGPNFNPTHTGSIRICRYRYTYIWQRNGMSYWAYITYVDRNSIAGFRWMRRRWVYFTLNIRQIRNFVCR